MFKFVELGIFFFFFGDLPFHLISNLFIRFAEKIIIMTTLISGYYQPKEKGLVLITIFCYFFSNFHCPTPPLKQLNEHRHQRNALRFFSSI